MRSALLFCLIPLVAFACEAANAGDSTAGGNVVEIVWDADGDLCTDDSHVDESLTMWSVNGGDCDCPDGYSPVGIALRSNDPHLVCLGN